MYHTTKTGGLFVSSPTIVVERQEARATITLNRPEALNALNTPLREGLLSALNQVAQDPGIRVVVLAGSGRAFSVGQDLRELESYYETHGPALGQLVEQEYLPIAQRLRTMPQPTIAVLDGPAVGGGLALALATDFRVISARAQLNPAFIHVGLAPDTGASYLLVKSLGLLPAISLAMTGRVLNADDLVRYGLASRINESPEALQQELDELAHKLAAGPTRAYHLIRQLMDQAASRPWEQVLQLERDVQDALAHTHDHGEAVDAFLHKRQPRFQGE